MQLTSTARRVLVYQFRRRFSVLELLPPVLEVRVVCLPATKPARRMAPGHKEKPPVEGAGTLSTGTSPHRGWGVQQGRGEHLASEGRLSEALLLRPPLCPGLVPVRAWHGQCVGTSFWNHQ